MQVKSKRQGNFFDVCGQCRINCCQNARPPITVKRKQIIKAYLEKQKIPIDNPFVQTAYIFPREDAEGYCIFHDRKTRKCLIHSIKPETCVAGPVTFDINMQNRKIEWFLKMEEICPLAGRLYRSEGMFKKHLETAKREISRLVRELDGEALRTILKIEEPKTFRIDEDNIRKDLLDKLTNDS